MFFFSFFFFRLRSMFDLCLAICYPRPGDMADLNCAYPCFHLCFYTPCYTPLSLCLCMIPVCRMLVIRTGKAEGESIDLFFGSSLLFDL